MIKSTHYNVKLSSSSLTTWVHMPNHISLVNGACSFNHNAGNSYCFLCTCTTAGPIIASFKVRIHAMQDLASIPCMEANTVLPGGSKNDH